MSDITAIKDRIKKLMAYANDGAASDGEIENAMAHAAKLIDAHHLNAEDFKGQEAEPGVEQITIGQAVGKTQSPKIHEWESTLAVAIEKLFGCVNCYISPEPIPYRVNGVAQFYTGKWAHQMKMCRQIVYYGPLVEAQEAASLYEEWVASIATMGTIRWGGAFRGDGAMYCQGFARQLYERASAIDTARQLTQAKPLAALPNEAPTTTAITLKDRYTILQERGKKWLKEEKGVKISSGARRSGSREGSSLAYHEGREHGSATEFSRKSQRKQLPPPK